MQMTRIVPREMWLYDDRCMMNWMGWLLSDHSAYLEQEASRERVIAPKPEMSAEALEECLQTVWAQQTPVAIQMNALYGERYLPDIVGVVVGRDHGQVFLQKADGQLKMLAVADMRHAQPTESTHWWAA